MKPGGIEASLITFLEYLSTENFEVTLLLTQPEGSFLNQIPAGIAVQPMETPRVTAWAKRRQARLKRLGVRPIPLRQILRGTPLKKIPRRLAEYIEFRALSWATTPSVYWRWTRKDAERFDIAISYNQSEIAPRYVAKKVRASKKICWYHHGDYIKTGWAKAADRRLFDAMEFMVAVSNPTKSLLTREFPSLARKTLVVENLLNPSRIIARSHEEPADIVPPADKLKLVTVSRLSEEKGIDLLIETAARLAQEGIDFIWHIVGDGPLREDLGKMTVERGLEAYVLFLGSQENPYPYVRISDIYVQPSRIEAHCIAVREALLLRKPIIASDIPVIRDALRDGFLGKLCRPVPEALTDSILRMDAKARALYTERIQDHFGSVARQPSKDLARVLEVERRH